jgi:hypothetical protein
VDNSLILQHSPSRAGSPSRIRGILEWAVIILINTPASIRTRDLWLWYHIELHAPTSSTQKLKLIGKGGQFTYTPTLSSNPGLGKKRSLLIPLLGMGDWWVGPRLVVVGPQSMGQGPNHRLLVKYRGGGVLLTCRVFLKKMHIGFLYSFLMRHEIVVWWFISSTTLTNFPFFWTETPSN